MSTTFFSNPEVFFGARREDFSPAQKRELIPTPSRCQPLSSAFFKKLVRPAVPASRPCPAQRDIPSRSGENGLCTSTPPLSTTFYFFLIFLPHTPRFYRVFAPVRAPKNCYLEIPPQEYPALPPKGRFIGSGNEKAPRKSGGGLSKHSGIRQVTGYGLPRLCC